MEEEPWVEEKQGPRATGRSSPRCWDYSSHVTTSSSRAAVSPRSTGRRWVLSQLRFHRPRLGRPRTYNNNINSHSSFNHSSSSSSSVNLSRRNQTSLANLQADVNLLRSNPVVLPRQPQQPQQPQQPPAQQPYLPNQQHQPQQPQQQQFQGQQYVPQNQGVQQGLNHQQQPYQQQPYRQQPQQYQQLHQRQRQPQQYQRPYLQQPQQQAGASDRLLKQAQNEDEMTWERAGQTSLFFLRGGTFSVVSMEPADFNNLIRRVANPTPNMLGLHTVTAIDIAEFSSPLPPGVAQVARTFDVHFRTFVRALDIFVRGGIKAASGNAPQRVDFLFSELDRTSENLQSYIAFHLPESNDHAADVFAHFQLSANQDWADFLSTITAAGRQVRHDHPILPPPQAMVSAILPPAFDRTTRLIAEGTRGSMVGLLGGGLRRKQPAPKPVYSSATKKRKAAAPAANARAPPALATQPSSHFAQEVLNWGTPHDACFHAWT